MEAPFFEKYLKARCGFELKNTASFRTGVNQWERYAAWPPKDGFHEERLYLAKGEGLSFAAPKEGGVAGSYVADPANPVPYRNRPIQPTYGNGSKWRTWLVGDQRFGSSRKDVANFETPGLGNGVRVTGGGMADTLAARTCMGADVGAKAS